MWSLNNFAATNEAATNLQPLQVGDLVTSGDKKVYRLMSDGYLRPIASTDVFKALGYIEGDVRTVSLDQLSKHPLASPITRWLTTEKDRNVYFINDGQRFRVPDSNRSSLPESRASPSDSTVTKFSNPFRLPSKIALPTL